MTLADALEELYGAPPEDFVALRTTLAKQARAAGDRDLAGRVNALRKPSVAAWAINLLVRRRPVAAQRLCDIGERLRRAQAAMDGATLAALRPDRDGALDEFVAAAAHVAERAGRPLAAAALDEVRASGVAALADGAAETAVVSGHLTRGLAYAGFGEVDLDDALAATVPHPRPRNDPATARRGDATAEEPESAVSVGDDTDTDTDADDTDVDVDVADDADKGLATRAQERQAREAAARERLAEADRALAEASLAAAEAQRVAQKARRRADELAGLLERARAEADAADEAARSAVQARDESHDALDTARAAFEEASAQQ